VQGPLPEKIENKGVIWCILGCLQGFFYMYVIMNMILLQRNLLFKKILNWKKKPQKTPTVIRSLMNLMIKKF